MTEKDKAEFKAIIQGYQLETNLLIKEYKKDTDLLVKKLKKEFKTEVEHYLGALSESHQHTIDAITENTKDIPEIKRMVEIMFENMGKQEIDIAVLKESVRNHERRIQKVEG